MILVRYTVNYLTRTVFRELNFDKQHEKNFKSMCDDVIEELSRSSEISIEQCIIVIAHNLVFSIRNNFPYNITQNEETKNADRKSTRLNSSHSSVSRMPSSA